ncbi:DNA primase, partial [Streptomyces parvus]
MAPPWGTREEAFRHSPAPTTREPPHTRLATTPLPFFEHMYETDSMATIDRQTPTLALAHALA